MLYKVLKKWNLSFLSFSVPSKIVQHQKEIDANKSKQKNNVNCFLTEFGEISFLVGNPNTFEDKCHIQTVRTLDPCWEQRVRHFLKTLIFATMLCLQRSRAEHSLPSV